MLKVWILSYFKSAFKTYLTVVHNWIWKTKNLEEEDVSFKAIEEKKTGIKVEHKTSVNFALTKSNAQPPKKEFVEWLK